MRLILRQQEAGSPLVCPPVTDVRPELARIAVFVGGVGLGKTHLSIALGMACCQHDYRVRFVTAAELVTMLVEAQQQGRLARKLAQLARYDVVHVEELDYVPLDKTGADLLFGFISQRYERRSLVVTTKSAVRPQRLDRRGVQITRGPARSPTRTAHPVPLRDARCSVPTRGADQLGAVLLDADIGDAELLRLPARA